MIDWSQIFSVFSLIVSMMALAWAIWVNIYVGRRK